MKAGEVINFGVKPMTIEAGAMCESETISNIGECQK
jgi:hypothetical protein